MKVDELPEREINDRLISVVSRMTDGQTPADSHLKQGALVTDVFLAQGLLSESQVSSVLEEVTGRRYINPLLIAFSQKFISHINELLSKEYLLKHRVLPIKHEGLDLHVVMHNPLNRDLIVNLSVITGSNIVPYSGTKSAICKVIKENFPDFQPYEMNDWQAVLDQALRVSYNHTNHSSRDIEDLLCQPGIIHLLRLMLMKVSDSGISDIHFEPQEFNLRIRIRQDGVLRTIWELPSVLNLALINRIKLLAGLDIIGHNHQPEDGRISMNLILGRKVDMRISTLPGIYGEKIVVRLLDKGKSKIALDEMGLDQVSLQRITEAMLRPSGMILLTGPTGSGKTTTLYALLDQLNHDGVNISTAEDPVEYDLSGITQVDCSKSDGPSFPQVLKSFLRQDPDIIMIGEIRDLETADIASKAALTGHILLSTLHTNNAPSAITRLMNIGIAPYILVACNITVVAQRLLRRVCKSCAKATQLTVTEQSLLELPDDFDREENFIYRGEGCKQCDNSGYKGRIVIAEVLVVDGGIEKAIINNSGIGELTRIAIKSGMITLRRAALMRMQQGLVTPEEVLRVTVTN